MVASSNNPQTENLDAGYVHESLQYPNDLFSDGINKAVLFHIYQYSKQNTKQPEKANAVKAVALPLPSSIVETMNVSYETNSIAAAEALMQDSLSGLIGGVVDLTEALVRDKFSDFVAASGSSSVTNPRNVNRFKDVGFKNHAFDFKLIARSHQESINIQKIINTFRYYMHPDIKSQNTFKHPEVFQIEFHPKQLSDNLHKPNPCALVGMTVSFDGTTNAVFFKDTLAPVEVSLSLQFQELQIETKETIRRKYNYKV